MGQAIRDDRDRDAIVQHLRRHGMAEIVQPKVWETRIPSATDERFRHPVRKPGTRAVVVATREHEAIGIDACVTRSLSMHGQSRDRRTRISRGVHPRPLPGDGLRERAVQHDVDPVHGARARVTDLRYPPSVADARVEVVDVRCRELGNREVTEVRFRWVLNETLCLADRARRPVTRCGSEPTVEQIADAASVNPGVVGVFEEALELSPRLPLATAHGPGDPTLSPARSVNSRVDAQLRAVRTASSNRAGHRRTLRGMAN